MKPSETIKVGGDWLHARALQQIFGCLNDEAERTLAVGGAVRNALMDLAVVDVDLSTTLLPQEVIERLDAIGVSTVPTGIEHGTVTAVTENANYEITTLREDIETDGRHATVKFSKDWLADAQRRDLTINALYCDAAGQVFDPLNGYGDLEKREVRFIGDAGQRIDEDALRILRFFRFFAHYGSGRPDANGLKACSSRKDSVKNLSAERVWNELKKLLSAQDPGRALLWMRTTGVLKNILPETEKWGIDSVPALIRVEQAYDWQPDPIRRLMTIIRPHADTIDGLAKRLKLSNREQKRLHSWAGHSPLQPNLTSDEMPALLYAGSKDGMIDALQVEAAHKETGDASGEVEGLVSLIEFARQWEKPVFPVKGADLMEVGVDTGPKMGDVLKRIETAWVESGFQLDKKQLLKLL